MLKLIRKIYGGLFRFLPINSVVKFLYYQVYSIAVARPAEESLKILLSLDQQMFFLTGTESVRYGDGQHTKHVHTKYHDYFCQNLARSDFVLDVGCGSGFLAQDMSRVARFVVGVDISCSAIDQAQKKFSSENLEFVCIDATQLSLDKEIDVIVLSNVLEHIEHRVDFLVSLQERYQPRSFLIRVPMSDRDWRVPLMDELGIDSRLDYTHYIEYTRESLKTEIESAHLQIVEWVVNWGESWMVVQSLGAVDGDH